MGDGILQNAFHRGPAGHRASRDFSDWVMPETSTTSIERLDIAPADRRMLGDLAEFAGTCDRVYRQGRHGLIPGRHMAEHAFRFDGYEGTFSLTRMADGVVYRALTVGQPAGMPGPGVVVSIAEQLGFTGSRRDGDAIRPGTDWQLTVRPGVPGYLVVFQPLLGFGRN
jgi:hypothetical protein